MRAAFCFTVLFSAFTAGLSASVGIVERDSSLQTIYSFPNGTALESLAVRASGQILACVITAAELYQINPISGSEATLVHSFPGYSSLLGIVEVEHDQFYVAAGNFTFSTLVAITGSWSIFHVDMSSNEPQISKVADFSEGQLLNGLGLMSKEQGLIYVADSYAGTVSLLNVYTGDHSVIINNNLTSVPSSGGLGVNGVHAYYDWRTRSNYVYWSNTGYQLLARMPIKADGSSAGEAEVVASNLYLDDFTFDTDGNVIQSLNGGNEIVRVNTKTGEVTVLAGDADSSDLPEPTAVQWGRTPCDSNSVYISLNGGLGRPTQVGGSVKRLEIYSQSPLAKLLCRS